MIVLISPAKTMQGVPRSAQSECGEPRFAEHARCIVEQMMGYSVDELAEVFRISASLANELKRRFAHFLYEMGGELAAVEAYSGVVYRHFVEKDGFSDEQRAYLQCTVRISSLLYGLLRPFDKIRPYRMEGFVRLEGTDERVDRFWRDVQTQTLIDDVQNAGGVLVYLASKEEQNAFYWAKVKRTVQVIDIKFLEYKGNKLRQVVVYTKMARGEMVRYMMENSIENPDDLKQFAWNGYKYDPYLSSHNEWIWVK